MTTRTVAAIVLALAVAGLLMQPAGPTPDPVAPDVPDVPAGPLSLVGAFVGADPRADALAFAALAGELAGGLREDGKPAWPDGSPRQPVITSGVALERVRHAASNGYCRGVTIGERCPEVRDRVRAYLDSTVGKSGKPFDDGTRAAWVAALEEVSRAATEAAKAATR